MSMNAFYEHHKDNIRFQYRCFDRILLNGLIQPFQQEERVVGFFGTYRELYPVSRDVLREIATQFHNWVINRSKKWGAPILDAPEGRRDEFVQPYFKAGSHLRAGLSLLSLLGSCLPESTSLDCQSFDPPKSPFPAIDQCLQQLFPSSDPAGNRRFIDGTGSRPLRAQMAHAVDSILHSPRTAARRRGPSALLFASRALRQLDLFAPGCRGSAQPAITWMPIARSASPTSSPSSSVVRSA